MRLVPTYVFCLMLAASAALAAPRAGVPAWLSAPASATVLPPRPGPPARPAGLAHAPYAPGEVLALVPPGSPLAALAAASAGGPLRAAPSALADRLAKDGITRAVSLRRALAPAKRRFEMLRLSSDDPAFDPHAVARDLVAGGAATVAAPNLSLQLHFTPNDPFLAHQWQFSTSAAAVRAPQAWDVERGSPDVVIAILDTGIDLTHSDLVSQVWLNYGEVWGDGLDNDDNGYADDVAGWDFGDEDNDPDPDPIYDPTYGIDVGWHGTFVAGLAAAATNNGVGVAGAAPGCQVMALKVSDALGDISLASVAEAFDYACAEQVSVLNTSLGTTDPAARDFFQALVDQAMEYDIVCVASAGNSGTDTPTYPAACDSVIAVASTNASNNRSSFSNWGPWVDIAAPGEGVWSCIARNYAYDSYSLYEFQALWGFDGSHAYMSNDGTSFAAPLVAGAVALMRSHFPWMDARTALEEIPFEGDARTYDDPIGPRLNMERPLQLRLSVGPAATGDALALAPPAPNPSAGGARLAFSLPREGAARLAILDAQGRCVRELAGGWLASGPHELAWDGRDAAGAPARPGLYFAVLSAGGSRVTRRVAVVR